MTSGNHPRTRGLWGTRGRLSPAWRKGRSLANPRVFDDDYQSSGPEQVSLWPISPDSPGHRVRLLGTWGRGTHTISPTLGDQDTPHQDSAQTTKACSIWMEKNPHRICFSRAEHAEENHTFSWWRKTTAMNIIYPTMLSRNYCVHVAIWTLNGSVMLTF